MPYARIRIKLPFVLSVLTTGFFSAVFFVIVFRVFDWLISLFICF